MPQLTQVYADLVGATGLQIGGDQGRDLAPVDHSKVRHGAALPPHPREALSVPRVPAVGGVDVGVIDACPQGQRQVSPLDAVVLEARLEPAQGLGGARHHEQSAGVLVEAVDDPRALRGGPARKLREVVEQGVDQRARGVPWRRVHDHTSGLVYHREDLVRVEDLEGQVLGDELQPCRFGHLDAQLIPGAQAHAARARLPKPEDTPRFDELLELGAAPSGRHETWVLVQAEPGLVLRRLEALNRALVGIDHGMTLADLASPAKLGFNGAVASSPEISARRDLPRVDELLAQPDVARLLAAHGRLPARAAVRRALAWARERLGAAPVTRGELHGRVRHELHALLAPELRRVVNATGVVLHTNLGRAPLGKGALEALAEIGGHPCDLELDLLDGHRGGRGVAIARKLALLTGCADALVVNNNAGAVLLALAALAQGGEVLVSRGELVEIGGSFRMPEVMALSGACLVEVGTTNRTRAEDYARACTERSRAILRVHRGNFTISGFREDPDFAAVVEVARRAGIPLLVDLGHGALVEPSGPASDGLPPTASACLEQGADLVLMSGDKLLGGPQAGIAVGEAGLVRELRRHPLHRPLRAGKLTLAALDATLLDHLAGRVAAVPARAALARSPEDCHAAAERVLEACAPALVDAALTVEIVASTAAAGGGSDARYTLPSAALALRHRELSCALLAERLRRHKPAVVGRIKKELLLLDLRAVAPADEPYLVEALVALIRST